MMPVQGAHIRSENRTYCAICRALSCVGELSWQWERDGVRGVRLPRDQLACQAVGNELSALWSESQTPTEYLVLPTVAG